MSSVVFQSVGDRRTRVTLIGPPRYAEFYSFKRLYLVMDIQVEAEGISVRSPLRLDPVAEVDLPEFLDSLAADYRGWTGVRDWRADHIALAASHNGWGTIDLRWTISPDTPVRGWRLTLTTRLDAGNQMTNLAQGTRGFFADCQTEPEDA
ncbi:DUF6228 family protein [Actinokineospora enzanensis]|uniref:DUF6228 family protein n=1 Tax=Actinokineospora enzanensis TaxID=155975 RepID=UPI000376DA7E|nr:DUF6228 family protein [Actinokineospora enzanensis]